MAQHPLEELYLREVNKIFASLRCLPLAVADALPEDLEIQQAAVQDLVRRNRLLRHHLLELKLTLLFVQN